MAPQMFWWKEDRSGGGVWAVPVGRCVLKIFPRDLHSSEQLARSRKGIKGKKTYTFDAEDVVPGMCVYPQHTNADFRPTIWYGPKWWAFQGEGPVLSLPSCHLWGLLIESKIIRHMAFPFRISFIQVPLIGCGVDQSTLPVNRRKGLSVTASLKIACD